MLREKDLDIDVKEVDTKSMLGLLGSKKIRITARIKGAVGTANTSLRRHFQPLMTLPKNMAKNSSLNWQPLPD